MVKSYFKKIWEKYGFQSMQNTEQDSTYLTIHEFLLISYFLS